MAWLSLRLRSVYALTAVALLAYPLYSVSTLAHVYLYYAALTALAFLLLLNQTIAVISWGVFLTLWWGLQLTPDSIHLIAAFWHLVAVECLLT